MPLSGNFVARNGRAASTGAFEYTFRLRKIGTAGPLAKVLLSSGCRYLLCYFHVVNRRVPRLLQCERVGTKCDRDGAEHPLWRDLVS